MNFEKRSNFSWAGGMGVFFLNTNLTRSQGCQWWATLPLRLFAVEGRPRGSWNLEDTQGK